jgi:phytoene synthase
LRAAFDALFDIDEAMADVVARSTQPTLGAIKLAWWRERLEELDEGKIPAEPRLQAAAAELLPRGISGAQLAGLEAGWAALLDHEPDWDVALARGATLFQMAARLLGDDAASIIESAGKLYAAGYFARLGRAPHRLPVSTDIPRASRHLRPLTGLAVLANRDLHSREPEGTPARAWALLSHRLTGRFPR